MMTKSRRRSARSTAEDTDESGSAYGARVLKVVAARALARARDRAAGASGAGR